MKFKVRSSEFACPPHKGFGRRGVRSFLIFILLLPAFCILPPVTPAGEKWSGVDESVIEKVATEHGREAREPFINTDQGDLLLFVFLLAGAVGGFVGGYYWRALVGKRGEETQIQKKNA
jgi:ABC-type cobalt transport system substrate-binding protein